MSDRLSVSSVPWMNRTKRRAKRWIVSLVRAASRSLGKHPIHFRGGGDDNQVDSGYHANLVADLGGIHIVLNGTVR